MRLTPCVLSLLVGLGCAPALAVAQPAPELAAKLAAMGRRVDPMGTAALYAPQQHPADPATVTVQRDVAYGPGPKDTLDLFASKAPGKGRPILIFVHSGAFRFDDKSHLPNGNLSPFYDNIMSWAVANGMVGVNMNYQLAPAAV